MKGLMKLFLLETLYSANVPALVSYCCLQDSLEKFQWNTKYILFCNHQCVCETVPLQQQSEVIVIGILSSWYGMVSSLIGFCGTTIPTPSFPIFYDFCFSQSCVHFWHHYSHICILTITLVSWISNRYLISFFIFGSLYCTEWMN